MASKTVLITGCSEGGIGDALAQEFHRKGLRVFATARNLSKMEHLKAFGLDIIALDVVDKSSIKQAVEIVKKSTGGTLDFLVNNSGVGMSPIVLLIDHSRILILTSSLGYALPLLDSDIEVAKKMFDVNVFGVMGLTQAFAPLLIQAKGTIINISSVAGCVPYPWHGYYSASKASLSLLTDQLRIELKPFGINAINIMSGGIETKFFDNQVATELPSTSLYAPWRKEVEWVANGGVVKGTWTPAEVYAQKVVKNALKRNPNVNYWVGDQTFMVWFMTTFLWHTVIVSFIAIWTILN